MSDIVIRLDLRLGAGWRRAGRLMLAGAMVFAAVPELASESVTLTTYYPAPSGVYTTMITTNNTFLARDANTNAGQVTIGGSASGTGQQLDVYSYMGSAGNSAIRATYPNGGGLSGTEFSALAHRSTEFYGGGVAGRWSAMYANQGSASFAAYFNGAVGGYFAVMPAYVNWATYGTGDGGAAIYNDANAYKTLMIVGNNSAGGVRQVSVWDQLNVNGNETVSGNASISGYQTVSGSQYTAGGVGNANSYVSAAALNTNCYWTTYAAGPTATICAVGYYVTMQSGFMSKYVMLNDGQNPNGDAWCCACPTISAWPWGIANSCPNM